MASKTFLTIPLTSIALASWLTSCDRQSRVPEHYNIVFIMADDHTQQMMSCYDDRHVKTPNIDRIADDGLLFTNSFVANSISGPSRACLLTGKHSHANGFKDNTTSVFDGTQWTFPKMLRQAGYETAIVGKWHLGGTPVGFDYWEILPGQGDYYNPHFITQADSMVQKMGYVTDIITDKSIDWLDNRRDKDKPFCLMIHHKAMHRNWMAALDDLTLYEDSQFVMPDNFYDDYAGREAAAGQEMSIAEDMNLTYDLKMLRDTAGITGGLERAYLGILGTMTPDERRWFTDFYAPIAEDFYSQRLTGRELAEWKYQRYMRDYAKTLKSLDDNVGRVLDYLERNGLMDNTIVIYTSDQGFYMGEHGWFDKRFMYEESMHMPLVIHLPDGLKRRGRVDELVQNIDFAPTFIELAGLEVPDEVQGVSLLPILRGDSLTDWRGSLYYHFYEYPAEHAVKRHYGVRTDRYKLIHFYNDIDAWELYDLQNDPHEMHNIYDDPAMRPLIDSLRTECRPPFLHTPHVICILRPYAGGNRVVCYLDYGRMLSCLWSYAIVSMVVC